MSHITSILMITAPRDAGMPNLCERLAAARAGLFRPVDPEVGRIEGMPGDLFIGAFDALDPDEFTALLRGAGWQFPDQLRIFVLRQGHPGFQPFLYGDAA